MPNVAVEFIGNDNAYRKWLREHPMGYVLNKGKGKSADYLVLHKVDCNYISSLMGNAQKGGFTERDYTKVCCDSISGLKAWLQAQEYDPAEFTSKCSCIG